MSKYVEGLPLVCILL